MTYKNISIQELYDLIQSNKEPFILDVRNQEEFQQVRIAEAINLPLASVSSKKVQEIMHGKGLELTEPIHILCRTGPRAVAACEILENDFDQVYHVVGCMTGWIHEDLPVEKA